MLTQVTAAAKTAPGPVPDIPYTACLWRRTLCGLGAVASLLPGLCVRLQNQSGGNPTGPNADRDMPDGIDAPAKGGAGGRDGEDGAAGAMDDAGGRTAPSKPGGSTGKDKSGGKAGNGGAANRPDRRRDKAGRATSQSQTARRQGQGQGEGQKQNRRRRPGYGRCHSQGNHEDAGRRYVPEAGPHTAGRAGREILRQAQCQVRPAGHVPHAGGHVPWQGEHRRGTVPGEPGSGQGAAAQRFVAPEEAGRSAARLRAEAEPDHAAAHRAARQKARHAAASWNGGNRRARHTIPRHAHEVRYIFPGQEGRHTLPHSHHILRGGRAAPHAGRGGGPPEGRAGRDRRAAAGAVPGVRRSRIGRPDGQGVLFHGRNGTGQGRPAIRW